MASDVVKPALTRSCPLCGQPMKWCGDVPTEDEPEGHTCHHITCTDCQYNVDFHGPELQQLPEFEDLLVVIAAKWNRPRFRDHQVAQAVTALTAIAREYGQTQQLRERIAEIVRPMLVGQVWPRSIVNAYAAPPKAQHD